jgi:hypothetical protein
MASAEYYELLLRHLKGSRQNLVDSLMQKSPPTSEQFRDVAHVQQAIAAVEAVIAEQDASSGRIPLQRS